MMNLTQLRLEAKKRGCKSASNMNKQKLLDFIDYNIKCRKNQNNVSVQTCDIYCGNCGLQRLIDSLYIKSKKRRSVINDSNGDIIDSKTGEVIEH